MFSTILIPIVVFSCVFSLESYVEEPGLTSHEKVKKAFLWAIDQNTNIEAEKEENPDAPYIQGGSFQSSFSFYPNLEMVVVSSTKEYDIYYDDNANAPQLFLTLQDDFTGETSIKEYTYHVMDTAVGSRLMDYGWQTSFFPLPDFFNSTSFLHKPSQTKTSAFVAFMSYPIDNKILSKPTFGKTLKALQIKGGNMKESNLFNLTGNVFVDFKVKQCASFFQKGFPQDYETPMKDWETIINSTGWSVGKDISLLMSFTFQGYFCLPMLDYVFLSENKKVSNDWRYCDKFQEDPLMISDPCCNREVDGVCNTFRDRNSVYVGKDSVCLFNYFTYTDLNLTNREKIKLEVRSYGMKDVTQYYHDFHFQIIPTILWDLTETTNRKEMTCRNILNNQDVYYDEYKECPIDIHFDNEIVSKGNCFVPSEQLMPLLVIMCEQGIDDSGRIRRFNTAELDQIKLILEDPVEKEYPYDSAHP
ncbi:hypothetical protein EIN_431080, partial [Entamoeba invadens IP1]